MMKPQHRKAGSAGKRWTGRKLMEWRRSIFMHEPMCRHCSTTARPVLAQEIDHITPLSKGGTYAPNNVQPLCKDCHAAKTATERGYTVRPVTGLDGWPIETPGRGGGKV
jgi:5-methylcytosine-specific restriction protein A